MSPDNAKCPQGTGQNYPSLEAECVWDLGGRLGCYRVNKDPIIGTNGSCSACPLLVRTFEGEQWKPILANVPKRHVQEGYSRGRGTVLKNIKRMEDLA